MKKIKIIFKLALLAITLTLSQVSMAQNRVKVGDSIINIHASAQLEVESKTRGFLPPRMTTAQRNAIANPATGLVLFNITPNCLQVNTGTPAAPQWQCTSGINPSTGGTAEASSLGGAPCAANTINGTLTQGVPVSGVTMTLNVNVTQLGTWNITAGPTNGVTFSGSGSFTALGCQAITLTASGTPATTGSTAWTTNTTPSTTSSATVVTGVNPILAQIGSEGDNPDVVNSVVTAAQIASIPGITGVVAANETAYQDYIDANPGLFSAPATAAEVQAMINAVNASATVLAQIGAEGDSPNTVPSAVTVAQINTIVPAVTGAIVANQSAYQAYIDANPSLFSAPATQAEVQAMINAVNASATVLAQIGAEGDSPNTVPSAVTVAQINTISPAVTGAILANQAAYQAYIDANPDSFSAPATQAQVQAMVNRVNAGGTIATINCAGATANGTLTSGTAASGVNSVISYTGGNGGTHSGQTVTSTGVTGLTATLAAGSFATGAGTLTYNITGTPASSGTATFAINIGGQTCNLTRTVAAPAPPSNPVGAGSFSGKTCFDIALGNDNTNSCGPLSARTATQANFTQAATHTQSYTFTPTGTVSNVRFLYINTTGSPVTAISGNNAGNNISTPVTATVNYVTTNTPFMGLTNTNPATVDIYVVYNDGATNNGTDRQLKLTANIKDCACCVAKVSATLWKEFLCHNLGADMSLDPHTPVVGLQGGYVQWGRRGPNTTGDSRVDWQTAANTTEFAAAPTAGNANAGTISGWNTTAAANNAWLTAGGAKTAADPCPSGFRVPTQAQWAGVVANNTAIYTGAWTNSNTYYGSSVSFGPNSTAKLLTLPAAGYRSSTDGSLTNRGNTGYYWSSTEISTNAYSLFFNSGSVGATLNSTRAYGFSVRCIAE